MPDVSWRYCRNGQQVGPVSAAVIRALSARGELDGRDLVWRSGMPAWTPLSLIPELQPRTRVLAGTAPDPIEEFSTIGEPDSEPVHVMHEMDPEPVQTPREKPMVLDPRQRVPDIVIAAAFGAQLVDPSEITEPAPVSGGLLASLTSVFKSLGSRPN